MIESLLVAWMLSLPANAGAQGEEPQDFSDQSLERRRRDLDDYYEVLSRQVEKDFSEEMDFETSLENDRLDFEKKLIEERKDFLQSLTKISPSRREAAFGQFWKDQQRRREEFIKRQDQQRREFDGKDKRGLRRQRRGVIEDYDNAGARRLDGQEGT